MIYDTWMCSVGISILSGYNQLPSRKMFWQECPDTFSPIVSESIRRDVFEAVLFSTHFNDNTVIETHPDRFRKVRPIIENINRCSLLYLPRYQHLSIDEMMIPYFGKHSDKQFVRGKPIRYGYKVWAICDSSGFTRFVEPYCGNHTKLPDYGMGQGPNVVAGLVEKGEVCPGTLLYFDNLFTSMKLLNWLSERGLGGTGTLRQNRVKAIPIPAKKEVEKGFKRGESKVVYTEDVSVVVWKITSQYIWELMFTKQRKTFQSEGGVRWIKLRWLWINQQVSSIIIHLWEESIW